MTPLPAIDSLTPEAIRVLCAEKLGWKRISCRGGVVRPDGEWVERMFTYSKAIEIAAPPFTTDANAALTLCAWMADKGWVYYASNDSGGPSLTFVHHSDSDEPSDCHTGTANTFALAVAKAFCVAQGMAV